MIYAGQLALSQVDPMYNNLEYTNQILGGGSSGRLFQTLRIEKGYTWSLFIFAKINRTSVFCAVNECSH
ncbi:insulinase family protein [Kordia sp.]|uniref:insulinase family protein n=1 Tax=Kordia sp. TaxID=1965332 RepID=UPI0025BEC115|nr:insulinase family protein [Kordia sp.]MCH2193065.1 insulinase family protein [Kordia sp.]